MATQYRQWINNFLTNIKAGINGAARRTTESASQSAVDTSYGTNMGTNRSVEAEVPAVPTVTQSTAVSGNGTSYVENILNNVRSGIGNAARGFANNIKSFGEYLASLPSETNDTVDATPLPSEANDTADATPEKPLYEQERDDSYRIAEENRKASEATAAVARERAVADANASYAKNIGSYGTNAEALAGAGLAGSGYSDYLKSRAYATQRGEIQNAVAQEESAKRAAAEAEAQAKAKADSTYYTKATAAKEKLDTSYVDLLALAKSGDYTADEIRSLATQQGHDNEGAEALANAAGIAYTEKEKTDYNTVYDKLAEYALSGDYSYAQIYDRAIAEGMSEEDAKALAWRADEPTYNELVTSLDSNRGAFDIKGLRDSFNAGTISQEVYDKVMQKYEDTIADMGVSFFDGCTNVHEVWARYAHAIWYGNLSNETKEKLTQALKDQKIEPRLYAQKIADPNSGIYRGESETTSPSKSTSNSPTVTWQGGQTGEQSYTIVH